MTIQDLIKQSARVVALVTSMCGLSAAVSAADKDFACRVVTIGGLSGIVLVQAETKELAAKAAQGATAFAFDNQTGTATSVVKCIDRREEQFSDYQFQQFFQSIGL